MKKMNNKGFSLVELIVVVLIMAIIAVALAPQVMKWVENSRKSTDASNYDSLVSAANIGLSDETTYAACITKTGSTAIKLSASTTGTAYSWTNEVSSLTTQMTKVLGDNFLASMKVKAAVLDSITPAGVTGTGYEITIDKCVVTRSKAPYNPNS